MIPRINRYGWGIILPLLFVVVIGVIMVYSASMAPGTEGARDSIFVFKRQLIWLIAGLGIFLFSALVDYHRYRRLARPLLIGGFLLLLLVMVPGLGRRGGGAQRWVQLGPFGLQPSELIKYILVIFLADLLARKQAVIHRFREGLLPALAVPLFFGGMVLVQPDMGNALCIIAAGWIMVYLAGGSLLQLVLITVPALPGIAYLVISKPYRLRRLVAFADPWNDSRGAVYQIIQSMTALGSGGWTGLGLGESRQKLLYLPAATTDFIFAIVGEELGFVGAALVVISFLILVVQGFRIAAVCGDMYGRFLAQGIALMLGLQAFINFGVVSSLLPTKGLPLPFISQGGSNLLCSFFAVGILVNIASQVAEETGPPVRRSAWLEDMREYAQSGKLPGENNDNEG